MRESGHGREGGELVGVEEEAAEPRAAHDRRERGERVTGEVDVLEPLHVREEPIHVHVRKGNQPCRSIPLRSSDLIYNIAGYAYPVGMPRI